MLKNEYELIKIGVVGEGNLTDLFVIKLLEADISVHLLDSNKGQNIEKSTVFYHDSLPNLVRSSSIIITVATDGPALEHVLFGEQRIVNYITVEKVIVDMSSVLPELIQEILEQLAEKEIQFLDAALINEEQSESDLMQMMLIGGDSHAYNKVLPVFQRIIKNVKHLGANGATQSYRQAFAVSAKKA